MEFLPIVAEKLIVWYWNWGGGGGGGGRLDCCPELGEAMLQKVKVNQSLVKFLKA